MAYQGPLSESDRLPLTDNLSNVYVLSLIVAILTVGVSADGLSGQNAFYPTEVLRQAFVANDIFIPFVLFWRGVRKSDVAQA